MKLRLCSSANGGITYEKKNLSPPLTFACRLDGKYRNPSIEGPAAVFVLFRRKRPEPSPSLLFAIILQKNELFVVLTINEGF